MTFLRGPGTVPAVTVQRAAELQAAGESGATGETGAGALIIDVREPYEFAQIRAPGAVLLPLGQLEQRLADLPRDRELLLMCRTGARSHNATSFLLANGFDHVANVEGGIVAWQGAGLPTTSGDPGPDEGTFSTT